MSIIAIRQELDPEYTVIRKSQRNKLAFWCDISHFSTKKSKWRH